MKKALFISVFIISTCGLIYELLAGTLASYLLGESVTQFSIIIGVYLFSMGLGSYISRMIEGDLVAKFVDVEILIGLFGGFSSAILFLSFSMASFFRVPLFFLVIVIGMLVGLEIPLLLRILRKHLVFKDLVSKVLTLDYIGALFASLLFPLFLVPKLGLVRTSFFFGFLNVGVAAWSTWVLPIESTKIYFLRAKSVIVLTLLAIGFSFSDLVTQFSEENLYTDEIIMAKSSPYQRIILTRWRDEIRLYLNGHLQFGTRDEYRYHEALVHPAMSSHISPRKILVLGGGDGMAVREILKYDSVESVILVDLDPMMTDLFKNNDMLKGFNNNSLSNPRVKVVNADAFLWLDENHSFFDVVIIDFPDPNSFSIGKLYTTAFYRLLKKNLNLGSLISVQSTSPLFAKKSFWCIAETIKTSGFKIYPYHVYVPSFGEWGFVLAGNLTGGKVAALKFTKDLKFLTDNEMTSLFKFPLDMDSVPVEINRLDNQSLVRYYEEEWKLITPY
ncbi:MAG: polyamine aminopropyltransferase [Leptospira sp.]|nr:polyamine aminopropyltransferase [Leptospira sp.]